jgi:hypothetical protein
VQKYGEMMSVKINMSDTVDSLTTEQLKWLSNVDPHFFVEHIEQNTIFDSQLTRLLLQLGAIKAHEMLAEKAKPDQKAS